MNFRLIGKIIAPILLLEALFMVPGALITLIDQEIDAFQAFALSIVIILIVAGILYGICRNAKPGFYAREGLVTTGLTWLIMSVFGCLPFYISGQIPSFVDAVFEMVSGFTTTGSSILRDVEALSRGMLYWRSFSHWVGGMGVLVFLMAVVPLFGKNAGYSLHILRAESPGPSVGKLVPRMKQTAAILYRIYIVLTVIDFLLLVVIGRMPVFDAVCLSFGTAGTGGFGVLNSSFASYSSAAQTITTIFMFMFGVNFSCYYLILLKHFSDVFADEELRLYLSFIVISIVLITWNIYSAGIYDSLRDALHHGAFQVATIMSTSGFATADFNAWPGFSKALLLFLMVGGACAGSTGGGFKMSRFLLAFKSLRRNIHENLHPNEISRIRFNNAPIDEKVIKNLNGYLAAYCAITVASFLLVSLDGFSIETNLSAVLATLNNIGPGFDAVGPTANFADYSNFSKIVLIFDMLAGRLEIFPILILFSRSTWKRK